MAPNHSNKLNADDTGKAVEAVARAMTPVSLEEDVGFLLELAQSYKRKSRHMEKRLIEIANTQTQASADLASQAARIQKLEKALTWIREIADKQYEGDEKLRSNSARTLIRISDKATEALGDKPNG